MKEVKIHLRRIVYTPKEIPSSKSAKQRKCKVGLAYPVRMGYQSNQVPAIIVAPLDDLKRTVRQFSGARQDRLRRRRPVAEWKMRLSGASNGSFSARSGQPLPAAYRRSHLERFIPELAIGGEADQRPTIGHCRCPIANLLHWRASSYRPTKRGACSVRRKYCAVAGTDLIRRSIRL